MEINVVERYGVIQRKESELWKQLLQVLAYCVTLDKSLNHLTHLNLYINKARIMLNCGRVVVKINEIEADILPVFRQLSWYFIHPFILAVSMVERDQLTLGEKGSSLSFLIIGWIIPDRLKPQSLSFLMGKIEIITVASKSSCVVLMR